MRNLFLALLFSLLATSLSAQELTVGTLNTEFSADTYSFKVSQTIQKVGFVDVWAFQKVKDPDALTEYTVAAGAAPGWKSFRGVTSKNGVTNSQHRKYDLLGLVYNSSRLRRVETVELHGIRSVPGSGRLGDADWQLRAALFFRLQDKRIKAELYIDIVHLKCRSNGKDTRARQAEIIKNWIEGSDIPVIITGDFNIPVQPSSASGTSSDAFQTLTSVTNWIHPKNPTMTQCSPNFNSMLDHFFVKEEPI